jgi:hypothetical protein
VLERVDPDDALRCRCDNALPCQYRATGEDTLCDVCRLAHHGHLGDPEGKIVVPLAFDGPDAMDPYYG